MNLQESVHDLLWVAVLQYPQHDPVDHLDEVLYLVVDASALKVVVDQGLVLVLINQLLEGKVGPRVEQLVHVADHKLALDALLKKVDLGHDLLGAVVLSVLQHLHHALQDRSKYYLGVTDQLVGYFLALLTEQLGKERHCLLIGRE